MNEIIINPSSGREILDFRLLGFCDVLVLGRYFYREARLPLQLHEHGNFLEICYLAEGQQFYCVGNKDYLLNGGDVLINYPHELHGTGGFHEGKGNLYWMILNPPNSQTEFLGMSYGNGILLYENLLQIPSRQFKLKTGSQKNLEWIFNAFNKKRNSVIKTEIKEADSGYFEFSSNGSNVFFLMNMRNYLLRFLLDVVESGQLRCRVDISDCIQHVMDQIKMNDETFYTMKQLAKIAGLSESRFKHRFKEETGTTPADYQLRYKIDRACNMLIDDKETILNTALSLGFSSSQYFATVFRRYMGIPPMKYLTMKSPEYNG
ncbi:MAG: AraC family transcriptional regulator [Planctomycetaceae bacterium]|jgi:AraC-like DNA-binding protein|nr:AraC family transcriptional regulator [Planctomycetaceae bacterium]